MKIESPELKLEFELLNNKGAAVNNFFQVFRMDTTEPDLISALCYNTNTIFLVFERSQPESLVTIQATINILNIIIEFKREIHIIVVNCNTAVFSEENQYGNIDREDEINTKKKKEKKKEDIKEDDLEAQEKHHREHTKVKDFERYKERLMRGEIYERHNGFQYHFLDFPIINNEKEIVALKKLLHSIYFKTAKEIKEHFMFVIR